MNSSVARTHAIRWAPVAARDLDEIIDYIATQDTPEAAVRMFTRLKTRIRALARHPARCRIVPELKPFGVIDYRELVVSPYRIFFRITRDGVTIIGVLDGRRDLEEMLIRRAIR
jgi:plasmid stabilization system protein ParE